MTFLALFAGCFAGSPHALYPADLAAESSCVLSCCVLSSTTGLRTPLPAGRAGSRIGVRPLLQMPPGRAWL